MSFLQVKSVNHHFGLPPRKSKDEMVGQVVYCVGTSLETLVSAHGPFQLKEWNEIVGELGGAPRNSFASLAKEIDFALDPVFDELDGDSTIADIRRSKPDVRVLARKLACEHDELRQFLDDTHGGMLLANFVTMFRKRQAEAPHTMPGQGALLGVASTRVRAASVEQMTLSWIGDQIGAADEVAIAAGFYDVGFIERVLKSSRASQVRLMFNGLGGQRLVEQRAELKDLVSKLSNERRDIVVRLAFTPGLFHSKLFLISKDGATRALVGSANATVAAFSHNEELLITLPEADVLVGYFDAAWKTASSLDALHKPADSLINFFRTGVLYFKPVATLATSVNPFRDLLKVMTNEEKALLGGIQLPYSDQATGIGPFNLRHAVQSMAGDDLWDDLGDETSSADEGKITKLSIKPWSVETCFGYWVPSALDRDWRARLKDAGRAKREQLERFRSELVKLDKEVLLARYREYLGEVRNLLTQRIPRLASVLDTLERNPFEEAYFEKFVSRVIGYLEDDTRLQRLAEPFISGGMPEIWEDAQAYKDFRTSFFEHLDRTSRLPGNKPKVARIILDCLEVDAPLGAEEEWSAMFEEFLKEYGWREDVWTTYAS